MKSQPEILEAAMTAGRVKAEMSTKKERLGRLAILSVMAGAFIALGGVLSVIIGCGMPELATANPGLQRLMSALVFPVGLILTVTFGAELFTGNNAVLMPGTLKGDFGPGAVLTNWAVVWVGNFIGAWLFTYFLVILPDILAVQPYESAITGIAEKKVSLTWDVCLLRGIGANWCVCLAVWLAIGAKTFGGKIVACILPVATFVALGYEHCVANMFFIPAGMMSGAPVTVAGLGYNLLFSTIGNIIGGALFVGCLFYWLHRRKN